VPIDINKIIAETIPNKHIPKFVVRFLKKIVHQDELNQLFAESEGLRNLDFIEYAFKFFSVSFDVKQEENFPQNDGKKYIFVSNHPLGGFDGVIIGYILGKQYGGNVKILANSILMYLEPMSEMFVPIDKLGGSNITALKKIIDLYSSDNQVLVFPSGAVARKHKGKIYDSEWKTSFITAALKEQRDVVPIYFDGKNSNFFYNLSKFRKFIGIKSNIEMLFFADELFKQRGNHFSITIGNTIPYTTFDKNKTSSEWAEWVKEQVYKLK
jgi:Putative hemolysin